MVVVGRSVDASPVFPFGPCLRSRRAMPISRKRASRGRYGDGATAPLPDSSAQQVPFSAKKREIADRKVVRLRAERDQLRQDNERLIKERAAAVAQAEATKRDLARAAASTADGESVKQLNQTLEKTLAETEAALEATSARTVRVKERRAGKRLDAAAVREREAMAAAVKAQEQRDAALAELEGAKLLIEALKAKVDTLERGAARIDGRRGARSEGSERVAAPFAPSERGTPEDATKGVRG